MLYKKGIPCDKKEEFIFEAKPFNEDIDLKEIAAIECFYNKHGYIPETYIFSFLNWATYMARQNVSSPLESIPDISMTNRCAPSQAYLITLFKKLGLNCKAFNVGNVLGTDSIHALTKVSVPTCIDGTLCKKEFIMDPTFRQFCVVEENRFNRYFEEPRRSVRKSTPYPGYFFNLTQKGKDFANNLICYGYFESTDDNLKQYFDPFALYVTPKEDYSNQVLLGKISCTKTSGSEYKRAIINCPDDTIFSNKSFDYTTPREKIEYDNKRLINRIKRKFRKNQLDEMFVIEDSSNVDNSTKTK